MKLISTLYFRTSPVFGHRTLPAAPDDAEQDWQASRGFRPVTTAPLYVSQAPGLATLYESASVRSSQENPILRASQDNPLRASQDNPLRSSQELLRSSQENPFHGIHEMLRSSQENPLRNSQEMLRASHDASVAGSHDSQDQAVRSSRDNPLRRSQENLPQQGYLPMGQQQTSEGFNSDGYYSNSEPESLNQIYSHQNLNNIQAFDWIRSSGVAGDQGQNVGQGQDVHGSYENYQSNENPDFLPSRYGDVPQRQETEGSDFPAGVYRDPQGMNPHDTPTDYYNPGAPGYYDNTYQQEEQPRSGKFEPYGNVPQQQSYPFTTESQTYPAHSQQAEPENSYRGQGQTTRGQGYKEDYKVQYKGRNKEDEDEVDAGPRKSKPKSYTEKAGVFFCHHDMF